MLYSQSLISRWLTLYDDPSTIANNLTLHTCEIEETQIRHFSERVVIGYVTSTTSHPDADKLTVCQVDCGLHGHFQICCGANNVGSDMFVPVALPGAHLPAIDLTIGARKLRGVESNGMICAKEELGIAEDQELHGIWILTEDIDDISDIDRGISLATKYPRLENVIYDVENKTITHRPDLMGHAGIARELYAIYQQDDTPHIKRHNLNQRRDYATQSLDYLTHQEADSQTKQQGHINISTEKCRAYYAIQLTNICVQRSTFHTRLQLMDLGLTPKNNWVDFSNLFMYQTGQPIHCFDTDTIQGDITIRQAQDGEVLVDLMDVEHILTADDVVIADDHKVLALAGVIGGKESAVTEDTKNITIELANFDPIIIRQTAIRHGVRTDASARFEKNINPLTTQSMIVALRDMMIYMQPDLDVPERVGVSYATILPLQQTSIDRSLSELSRIIGDIPEEYMNQALEDLGFTIQDDKVSVPRRRSPKDITLPADIAEEVIRIVGYDTLTPKSIPNMITQTAPTVQVTLQRQIENILTTRYHADSVETYPWAPDEMYRMFNIDEEKLPTLQNPLQPEQSHLSHSLLYNLLSLVIKNHKFYESLRPYTIGSVRAGESRSYADTWGSIAKLTEQTRESRQIGGLLYNASSKEDLTNNILTAKHMIHDMTDQQVSFLPTSSTYFHPRQQAAVHVGDKTIGFIGRIHPIILDTLKLPSDADLVYYTLDLSVLESLETNTHNTKNHYHTLQDQILIRDLSFVVDRAMTFEALIDTIQQVDHVHDVTTFDVYQGEHLPSDKKSIALQLTIHHPDNNLTTDQINTILDQAITAGHETGAILRKDFNG